MDVPEPTVLLRIDVPGAAGSCEPLVRADVGEDDPAPEPEVVVAGLAPAPVEPVPPGPPEVLCLGPFFPVPVTDRLPVPLAWPTVVRVAPDPPPRAAPPTPPPATLWPVPVREPDPAPGVVEPAAERETLRTWGVTGRALCPCSASATPPPAPASANAAAAAAAWPSVIPEPAVAAA